MKNIVLFVITALLFVGNATAGVPVYDKFEKVDGESYTIRFESTAGYSTVTNDKGKSVADMKTIRFNYRRPGGQKYVDQDIINKGFPMSKADSEALEKQLMASAQAQLWYEDIKLDPALESLIRQLMHGYVQQLNAQKLPGVQIKTGDKVDFMSGGAPGVGTKGPDGWRREASHMVNVTFNLNGHMLDATKLDFDVHNDNWRVAGKFYNPKICWNAFMGEWEISPYVPAEEVKADLPPAVAEPEEGEPVPIPTGPSLKVPPGGPQETGKAWGAETLWKAHSGVEATGNDKLGETSPEVTQGWVAGTHLGVWSNEDGDLFYRERTKLGSQVIKAQEGQSDEAAGAGTGGFVHSIHEVIKRTSYADISAGLAVIASKNSNGSGVLLNPSVSYFGEPFWNVYAYASGLFGNTETVTQDYKIKSFSAAVMFKGGERNLMNNRSYGAIGPYIESTNLEGRDGYEFSSDSYGVRAQGNIVVYRFKDKDGEKVPRTIFFYGEGTKLIKSKFKGTYRDATGSLVNFRGEVPASEIVLGLGLQF